MMDITKIPIIPVGPKGYTVAEARQRNWLVMRLRGAYALFRNIGSEQGMAACEAELTKLNAETEAAGRERRAAEHEKLEASRAHS